MRNLELILLVSIAIIAFFLTSTRVIAAFEKNLVRNPSMEEKGIRIENYPEWWQKFMPTSDTVVQWVKGIAYEGDYSIMVGPATENGRYEVQTGFYTMSVLGGQKYKASVYVKTEGVRVGEKIKLIVAWWGRDDQGTRRQLSTTTKEFEMTKPDNDWMLLGNELQVPADILEAQLQIGRVQPAEGYIWIDSANFSMVLN